MIQPFKFQYCTAFRERQQLADKLNQIINRLNDVNFDTLAYELEEINTRIDGLENDIEEINKELHPEWELAHEYVYDVDTRSFTKDVKVTFNFPYHYKLPNDDTIYDDEYMGEFYIEKGTQWGRLQQIVQSYVSLDLNIVDKVIASTVTISVTPEHLNAMAIRPSHYNHITVLVKTEVDNETEIYYENMNMIVQNYIPENPYTETGYFKFYTKVES